MKIVFFGTPRLAEIVLENLISSDFKPQLVITATDKKAGRGQKFKASPVKLTALKCKIDYSDALPNNSQIDLAILVAFGQIIPPAVLKIPKYGFINVHPSLLPKYRGPSPIQSAILAGEKTTGASIIKLDSELDHGPILAQKSIDIEAEDTHLTLTEKLGAIGSNLLLEVLPEYASNKLKPIEQKHNNATYSEKITKEDGYINLLNPPNPLNLNRMIRAYYPWPSVWTEVGSKKIKLLPEKLVQLEGKKPMTIEELKNGFPYYYQKLSKISKFEK